MDLGSLFTDSCSPLQDKTIRIHEVNQEQETTGHVQQLMLSHEETITLNKFQLHLSWVKLYIKNIAMNGFDTKRRILCLILDMFLSTAKAIG